MGYRLQDDQSVLFFCKDTGVGLPESEYGLIFERFIKLNPMKEKIIGGSGLGLAISRQLVDLMGGTIWVESKVGVGSAFYFTIPLKFSMHPQKAGVAYTQNKMYDWSDRHILIAEDEESNYRLLEAYLKPSKINLYRATDGTQALAMLNTKSFDLLLLDILMPGMNGYEVASEASRLYPEMPIVFQTAYTTYGAEVAAHVRLAREIIYKPVSRQKIYETLERLLIARE